MPASTAMPKLSLNLSLNAMKIFLAVFDCGSVGGAASRLGMSQPGVSSALARLRALLSDELFLVTGTGVRPTERAIAVRDAMQKVVACVEGEILGATGFDPSTDERELRIALSDVGEAIYMPLAINALRDSAPRVTLRSVSVAARDLQAAMSDGSVDLAAGYFPDIQAHTFLQRRIGAHSFACIASRQHALARSGLTLAGYTGSRHVVVESQGRSQEVFERFLARRKLVRPVGLRTPHFMSLPVIVSQTDLIATVPQALADFFSSTPEIVQLKLPFVPPTFQSHMYWSRRVHQDAGNAWLRARLIEAFGSVGERDYARNGKARADARVSAGRAPTSRRRSAP